MRGADQKAACVACKLLLFRSACSPLLLIISLTAPAGTPTSQEDQLCDKAGNVKFPWGLTYRDGWSGLPKHPADGEGSGISLTRDLVTLFVFLEQQLTAFEVTQLPWQKAICCKLAELLVGIDWHRPQCEEWCVKLFVGTDFLKPILTAPSLDQAVQMSVITRQRSGPRQLFVWSWTLTPVWISAWCFWNLFPAQDQEKVKCGNDGAKWVAVGALPYLGSWV